MALPGGNDEAMADEIMAKRTNGSGGSGSGRGGSAGADGAAARGEGPRKTRNLCAEFARHFSDFEDACYRAPSLEGPGAAAIWRRLAQRLEASIAVAATLLPVLRADIVDLEKGSTSVADDLPKEPPSKP